MKRKILLLSTLLGLGNLTFAQKLALYEEFSGENCGPCAAKNPALMNLLNATGNDTKVLLLKYQSPIPSAGSIYNVNTVFTDARMDYYAVDFAPMGLINGVKVGTGANQGDIALTTQAMINAAAAETTPFTISVGTPVYNAEGQFTATITVTANTATNVANTKLRVALAEELSYTTAPGTNGETHFDNVVRQMYPNAGGQNLDAAWTAGQSRTYTVSGSIPSYVSAAAPKRFLAAFIQKDDATKAVLQAAKTGNITIQLPQADAALVSTSSVSNMKCQVPATFTDVVTVLKNTGAAALTSAKIYYKVSGATSWQEFNWTGNLAVGQTTNVTLPAINVPNAGQISIIDSVGLPNTKTDLNDYDNVSSAVVTILNPTAQAMPLSYDFEAVNSNWVSYTNGEAPIIRVWSGSTSQNIGYNNSVYASYYPSPYLTSGEQGYLIFPKAELPAGPKALDFYLSYALRGTVGDKLEVVYSTDCGANWTSVWSAQQAELATTTATPTNQLHIPSASTWQLRSIDISNVPANAYLAFRATSGGGNYMFMDNVTLRSGATTNIEEVLASNSLRIFPNPVENRLNVSLEMKKSESVTFSIVNTLGQEVTSTVRDLNNGKQQVEIETANLAAGMYILNIKTKEGNTQQKFIKK